MIRTMPRALAPLALALLLAGCDGEQPFDFGQPAEPPTVPTLPNEPIPAPPSNNGVPEVIGGNLESATYTPPSAADPDGALTVRITALDANPITATYERNALLDVPGYTAYQIQDDPRDRFFIGMAARSADGSIEGVTVVDGGQFNRYFGGVNYERIGPYTQPTTGLVSYAGEYVGMLNGPAPRPNQAEPYPPGASPSGEPGQALRVTGNVFLNVDFGNGKINGEIFDRRIVDIGLTIPTVTLVATDITTDGRFEGTVEEDGVVGTSIGSYAGAFGGTGATSVAGGIRLVGDFIPGAITNEEEYGLFVLDRCGPSGADPGCVGTNP